MLAQTNPNKQLAILGGTSFPFGDNTFGCDLRDVWAIRRQPWDRSFWSRRAGELALKLRRPMRLRQGFWG